MGVPAPVADVMVAENVFSQVRLPVGEPVTLFVMTGVAAGTVNIAVRDDEADWFVPQPIALRVHEACDGTVMFVGEVTDVPVAQFAVVPSVT